MSQTPSPDNREQTPKATIAAAVRAARARRRLTQEALALAAGTTKPRVSEIETESGNPRLDTLTKIVGALGLELRLEESAA